MSKLDELKEKFEGFVDDLKSKLPLKKGADDDEYEDLEDEDEFEENTSKVNVNPEDLDESTDSQTLTDIDSSSTNDAEEDDEDDEDEEDEEDEEDDKKAKQKKMLIRGAIVLLVAVLALDFLMPTEDDNVVPDVPVVKKKKRRRPKRKRKVKPKVAESKETVPAKPTEAPKVEPVKKVVVQPTVAPTIAPTPEPTIAPKPVETPMAAVVEPKPVAAEPKTNESIPPETPNEPLKVEVPNTLNLGENSNEAKPSLTMDEQVDKILKKSKESKSKKTSMSDEKIDPKMDYVTPPNYKRLGRGLVYNCIGKHWACVDKFSFFQCLENTKWSTANKKNPECVTNNVYASDEDCAVVQTHYINTREATEFCETQGKKDVVTPSTKVVVP